MPHAPVPRDLDYEPVAVFTATRGLSDADLGLAIGRRNRACARRAIQRMKSDGLTLWEGDAVATALGLHPAELWGDAWWCARPELDGPDLVFWQLRVWAAADERERAWWARAWAQWENQRSRHDLERYAA